MNKAIPPPQEQSIPLVLAGKDLIGCAQTGTGKQQHLPYLLHQLHRIVGSSKKAKQIRALVTPDARASSADWTKF
jgi:ATP-dependent RNA helicase RhlE